MRQHFKSACTGLALLLLTSFVGIPASQAASRDTATLIPMYKLLLLADGVTYHKVNVLTEGLAGSGFTILLNGDQELPIPADGEYSFPTELKNLSNYRITVKDPITGVDQACWMSSDTGIISSADAQVKIDCTVIGYRVGGAVTGLDGVGLGLALEDLTNGGFQRRQVKANGDFVLGALEHGTQYEVTVVTQPGNKSQTCVLTNPTGTASATSIDDLGVNCTTNEFKVGAAVYGLASGESLQITNNVSTPGAESITVRGSDIVEPIMSNTFSVKDRNKYALSVTNAPAAKLCQISNPSGTVDGAPISDIVVRCGLGRTARIGGTVTGLLGNRTTQLGLTLNGGLEEKFIINPLPVGDVAFVFETLLPATVDYDVTVTTQPNVQKCTVSAYGSGTVGTGETGVVVSCLPWFDPSAIMSSDEYIPNGGVLDGSNSTAHPGSDLTFTWGTPTALHDFSITGNGTTDALGATISTNLFDDWVTLDDPACWEDPECAERAMLELLRGGDAHIDSSAHPVDLIQDVEDDVGHESSASAPVYVYNEDYVYVTKTGTGDGSSPDNATRNIKAAITYARDNSKSRVVIAEGTYMIDIDSGPIEMVEGVSLYGGYNATTWEYAPASYPTDIRASGTGLPSTSDDFEPVATIVAGPAVTSATKISGLYVYSPNLIRNLSTSALWINGGDLMVRDSTLRGFNSGGTWFGLTITNGSESRIQGNVILGDASGYTGALEDTVVGGGIIMFDSTPTIESNRIRGGGAQGTGISVANSRPNIFNNAVLGCEDGLNTQRCIGIRYVGDDRGGAGGKLYNNTIFGSMAWSDGGGDLGARSVAVEIFGTASAPNIYNNILYAHNDTVNDTRAACVESHSTHPGGQPASLYNNACIRGVETCFARMLVPDNKSLWETLVDEVKRHWDSVEWDPTEWDFWSGNDPIYASIMTSLAPLEAINTFARASDGYKWVCRDADDSNHDPIAELYGYFFNDEQMEFFGINFDLIPSDNNIDLVAPNFFVDIDGPDNDVDTIADNDWHLAPSALTEVKEGGQCLAPDVMKDLDQDYTRTPLWSAASGCVTETGYSMGAFEDN